MTQSNSNPAVRTTAAKQNNLPMSMFDAVQLYLVPPFEDSNKKDYEYFAFLTRDAQSITHQYMCPRDEIEEHLKSIDVNCDTWLCPNSFYRKKRGNEMVSRLGAVYVDLDFYKIERFQNHTPARMKDEVLWFCEQRKIPRPSYIKSSGRGLQILWLFERAIPAKAVGRWRVLEKNICKKFDELGSDHAATDPARMLRLEGTINKKNLCYCQPLHVEMFGDKIKRYNFEYLCEYLPAPSREEGRKISLEKQQKRNSKKTNKKKRTGKSRFRAIAEDLEKLIAMRRVTREGLRMLTLFWRMNFLALAGLVSIDSFLIRARQEAVKIDRAWDYSDADIAPLLNRYKSYRNRELKEALGRKWLALFTPSNETLINQLQITDNELNKLSSLQQHARKPRPPKSGLTMQDRSRRADDRRKQAIKLRLQGKSIREIAAELRISKSAVQRYVVDADRQAEAQAKVVASIAEIQRLFQVSHSGVCSGGSAIPLGNPLCVSTITLSRGRDMICPASPRRRARSAAGAEVVEDG